MYIYRQVQTAIAINLVYLKQMHTLQNSQREQTTATTRERMNEIEATFESRHNGE